MGKTYRKKPYGYYRHPKGSKQAKINGGRNRAIPPDAWEDVPPGRETEVPRKAASDMHSRGFSDEEIVKRVKRKFKYSHRQARDLLPRDGWWYQCKCEECKRLWNEWWEWRESFSKRRKPKVFRSVQELLDDLRKKKE